MAKKRKTRLKLLWDTCAWIDFFKQAKDTYQYLRGIADAAEEKKILIVASTVALAETWRYGGDLAKAEDDIEQIRLYMQNEHVHLEAAHHEICEIAQDIQKESVRASKKILAPDAIQIATAVYKDVPAVLTLEGQHGGSPKQARRKMLRADKLFHLSDGTPLRIQTPSEWVKDNPVVQLKLEEK